VQRKVSGEIERYFNHVLNRPEILNRLGKNIIVFDWIRQPVATRILDQMIADTLKGVAEQDIAVDISDAARAALAETCLADLSNGGRGIRNQIEAHLVNPLARALFDADARPGSRYTIAALAPGEISTVKLVSRTR
jgi:ATP-dependent Clp protease ATP-binding subunit ClpA